MNKIELAAEVAKKTQLSKTKALDTINCTLEAIKASVKRGQRVQLIGFGSFLARHRKARLGRNPKTGEVIQIKARKVPVFQAGTEFKKTLR